MPICYECGLVLAGIHSIQVHLKRIHNYDEQTAIYKCGELQCHKTYPQWSKYRTHLKSFHKFSNSGSGISDDSNSHIPPKDPCVTSSQHETGSLDFSNEEVASSSFFLSNQSLIENSIGSIKYIIKSEAGILVGKLYSKPGYPRKFVQDYAEDTTDFMFDVVSIVEDAVRRELLQNNVDPSVVERIGPHFSVLRDPFSGLNTEHNRFEYLLKHGYYIPSISYNIAPDMFTKISKGKVIYEIGNAKGGFIQVRKTLKAFMELPNVLKTVIEFLESPAPCGIISEFIHGSHWISKRKLFPADCIVIPYFFFFDEYEVDKDLGSHSAKQGAVYIKLACFPPEFQGEVENVFLALLFNHVDRKDYSTNNVFHKLIEELKFLQDEGITIDFESKSIKVYFVIGLGIGDNLGIHMILSLVESFSAIFCCRFCYVTKVDLYTMTIEDPSLMRSVSDYTLDVEAGCAQHGVNGPFVLSEIEHFHPMENPFCDLMHDVDEGMAVYDMQHILFGLIYEREYFDVDTLNATLVTFKFSPDVSNRPIQLSQNRIKNKNIKMTAAEMRTFVRVLALLVGDLVSEDDPWWKLYLLLREIYDILLCSCLQSEMASVFKSKIAQHHRLYLELTADTLKLKHHFVIHYPEIMLKSGSFVKNSCHRLEAKHQQSIQDARATKSRKFIALTIAIKEQLRFANRLQSKKGLYSKFEVGSERTVSESYSRALLPPSFKDSTQYSSVNFKGTTYKKDVCVIVDANDDDGPKFGIVLDVYVKAETKDVGLVCKILSTVSFSKHFHAYQVVVPKNVRKKFLLVNDLFDYHPVWFTQCNDGLAYVTLHHIL